MTVAEAALPPDVWPELTSRVFSRLQMDKPEHDYELTADKTIELLRRTVAEIGRDHVYDDDHRFQPSEDDAPVCVYIHQGQPSCLVGHVLINAGFSVARVEALEGTSACDLSQRMPVSPVAAQLLDVAQWHQDEGGTWGVALDLAEQEYTRWRNLSERRTLVGRNA